jgi:quercetin dioxygenase-like cupin family protein
MKTEITGITRANEGMQGISWNILGQTYVPKNCTEHSFSWHATLPPGTFVPPHIHPDQDEYLYMLEGKLDFMLGGAEAQATAGDLIRLGMGVASSTNPTRPRKCCSGYRRPENCTISSGACTT